ncbi:MAG TPA: efflux RND transporter periplasmic adaptor subunit [Silvibacterium sp.]|jgi:multidrug efflux system membrane fusion protein|nr:efflux RND transporter periplasmic adaptor subunit [Silvibacterium sp.]
MEQKPPDSPISPDHQLPPPNNDAPKRPKKRRLWVWVVVLLIFALIFVLVLRHHNTAAGRAGGRAFGGPVTLTATTAKKGDIGVYLDAIGTVTPVFTTTLYNQVTGVITAVHYREGQMVRKGDPLVDIDPRQFEAQVMTAEGNLIHDTNVLALARMDLERYRQAWARNAIPKQQLDDQEKTVLQTEGLVKADQGTLDFNKVQLSYCHITSPITGRVSLRLVDPGNLVQSSGSTILAVVTQMEPITVIFTLAQDHLEQVLPQVRRGAKLTVDAYDRTQENKIATGRLLALDNQVDTTTGTIKLRALFENKKDTLFPNQFVNTRLLVTTQHEMTLIPSSAIQHNGEVAFVYVIENNTAHVRNVTPGTTDAGITAVQGINPGDVVATSSFEKLQDGAKTVIAKKPVPQDTSESSAP